MNDIIKEIETASLESVKAEIKTAAIDEVMAGTVSYKFGALELSVPALRVEIADIAGVIGAEYAETYDELKKIPAGELNLEKLMFLIKDITVDGESVYADSEYGKVFVREKLVV